MKVLRIRPKKAARVWSYDVDGCFRYYGHSRPIEAPNKGITVVIGTNTCYVSYRGHWYDIKHFMVAPCFSKLSRDNKRFIEKFKGVLDES